MSRRFGRNQRRRARERVAALEYEVSQLSLKLTASRHTVSELQDEIDCAKRIAGQHCAAFSPQTMEMRISPAEYVTIAEHEHMHSRFVASLWQRGEPTMTAHYFKTVSLPVMMVLTDPEWRARAKHVIVQFAGGRYGYAVDTFAFHSAREPRAYLRTVGEILSKLIYNELTKNMGKSEPPRQPAMRQSAFEQPHHLPTWMK